MNADTDCFCGKVLTTDEHRYGLLFFCSSYPRPSAFICGSKPLLFLALAQKEDAHARELLGLIETALNAG
jgi:hypothetical protein